MAERRMFAKSVIGSAKFLRMPVSTQLLYFHLGMDADDDGVVEAYPVMRKTGLNEDDLKVLAAKGFVTVLNEDLVSYITDWSENNKMRADRKIDSRYKNLLIQMIPDVNIVEARRRADTGKFTGRPLDDQWTSNGQPMDVKWTPQDRLGEDRLGKDSTYISPNGSMSVCSEPSSEASEPAVSDDCCTAAEVKDGTSDGLDEVFIMLPVFGRDEHGNGNEVPITEGFVRKMEELYRACDVRQSIRNAVGWCMSHPNNRKKNWQRFLTGWLQGDNDKARVRRDAPTSAKSGYPPRKAGIRDVGEDEPQKSGMEDL